MNKATDFGEVIMIETDDYDKFPRKKLIKAYNKYNDIMNAFKRNMFYIGSGLEVKNVLTKFELKLIHEEIENTSYKYLSKEQARDALLKYYMKELTDCVEGMKQSIYTLPEDIKATHYECECGSKVLTCNKAKHLKSPLHKNQVVEIPTQKATHFDCDCGSKVLTCNKAKHLKSPLHMNFINKIPLKPKSETTIHCGCGKTYTSNNKSHHEKTQYHLDWVNCNEISI